MAKSFQLSDTIQQSMPEKGILSRTIFKNEYTTLVIMQLAPGEELTEHTSKFPVWIQTIDGEGVLKTPNGEEKMSPGTWICLDPSEEHAVYPVSEQTLSFALIIMKKNQL